MNLTFKELLCPKCGEKLEQGNITVGVDVQMVKRCYECEFWMIIIIPNDEFDYSVVSKQKSTTV
jgi:NAD-dependent SIR2 family protein deacetylase